jgi:hypothetical protein
MRLKNLPLIYREIILAAVDRQQVAFNKLGGCSNLGKEQFIRTLIPGIPEEIGL